MEPFSSLYVHSVCCLQELAHVGRLHGLAKSDLLHEREALSLPPASSKLGTTNLFTCDGIVLHGKCVYSSYLSRPS